MGDGNLKVVNRIRYVFITPVYIYIRFPSRKNRKDYCGTFHVENVVAMLDYGTNPIIIGAVSIGDHVMIAPGVL